MQKWIQTEASKTGSWFLRSNDENGGVRTRQSGSFLRWSQIHVFPFVFTVFVGAQASLGETNASPERIEWPVMSTTAAVSTPAAHAADLPALRDLAQPALSNLEHEFSIFIPDSDLSRVNVAAGSGEFVGIAPEVAHVLRVALGLSRDSSGVFDPTIGPLMKAWGFRGGMAQHAPTKPELAQARARVGWTNVIWDAANSNCVRLALAGMRLDLGGIAKGYAVDVVYDRVLEKGERDFLVDLGGNLRVHGESAPGRGGWRTGVRNPFDLSEIVGMILLTNGESVATSGNYERFVKMDGRHYAHIMDTRTGHPAEGVAGVTVLAPSGVQCDGLSATLFILGPEAGQKFLTRFRPECEALWIPDSQPLRMFASPGFARRFHPLPEYQDAVTVLKP
jgi:thiamine biosynthesis lipoprotein